MFGLSEAAIILVVVILVLAAKKLPDLARSAGKSARILKAEAAAAQDEPAGADGQTAPRVIPGETVGPRHDTPLTDTVRPSAAPDPTQPDSGQPRPQE
ncbi:twin-arginine translocase TatA/TatE family subunit [Streptomyces sp. ActVer]|uniref:twin-arginine translocase TatA/TatE family subunit n=1 Tax=Streptomyces sp. ActVer TaxID=3014558 RepID=UPI0022B3E9A7|nr:twin-arginine translocase TatA/TatE family subunit [Streptomyces sp. ActVer]MCZ4510006.1 twin-arginine translocase TatA/TatE family subunit [Streptomyces sp. ActVer]